MSKNTTENYFALATLGTMIFLGIQRYSISGCYFLVNIAHGNNKRLFPGNGFHLETVSWAISHPKL